MRLRSNRAVATILPASRLRYTSPRSQGRRRCQAGVVGSDPGQVSQDWGQSNYSRLFSKLPAPIVIFYYIRNTIVSIHSLTRFIQKLPGQGRPIVLTCIYGIAAGLAAVAFQLAM